MSRPPLRNFQFSGWSREPSNQLPPRRAPPITAPVALRVQSLPRPIVAVLGVPRSYASFFCVLGLFGCRAVPAQTASPHASKAVETIEQLRAILLRGDDLSDPIGVISRRPSAVIAPPQVPGFETLHHELRALMIEDLNDPSLERFPWMIMKFSISGGQGGESQHQMAGCDAKLRSAGSLKGVGGHGRLPAGQTAKFRPGHRVQSLPEEGHGRRLSRSASECTHRFLRLALGKSRYFTKPKGVSGDLFRHLRYLAM